MRHSLRVCVRCWAGGVVCALLLMPGAAVAVWQDDVLQAMHRIADGEAVGADAAVVFRTPHSAAEWQEVFGEFFSGEDYTEAINAYWSVNVESVNDPMFAVAAVCAAEGAAAALRELQPNAERSFAPLRLALFWLQSIAGQSTGVIDDAVLSSFEGGGEREATDVTPMLREGDRPQMVLAMQTCLTLAEFTGRDASRRPMITRIVTLPEACREAWETHGFFLFDRAALDAAQLRSLNSLAASIPSELHVIAALLVPEALGLDAAGGGLVSTGSIVPIELIPMTVMSNPSEFVPEVGQPVAPEFTLSAGLAFFRAIEAYQFAQRPALRVRRDRTLYYAGGQEERYLRRFIAPGAYAQNPEMFLPATFYLYLVDSERTFRTAMELFDAAQKPPMDAFLLTADVLSGGGGQTLLFNTTPGGIVSSRATPVARVRVSRLEPIGPSAFGIAGEPVVDYLYLNGIRILGFEWLFELGTSGSVARVTRSN